MEPVILTNDEVNHLQKVLEYYWDDEYHHFLCTQGSKQVVDLFYLLSAWWDNENNPAPF
jgi:hypothetical protein